DREERVFQLVGEWEADPTSQKISHESPLGQALIGKKLGEKVEIDAPVGKLTYTIKKIE
ncbi:MAG: GreA/GreB family elongation factor, partial [bacterium]|nr:GreA/GreB family elongation factor [bacterium]